MVDNEPAAGRRIDRIGEGAAEQALVSSAVCSRKRTRPAGSSAAKGNTAGGAISRRPFVALRSATRPLPPASGGAQPNAASSPGLKSGPLIAGGAHLRATAPPRVPAPPAPGHRAPGHPRRVRNPQLWESNRPRSAPRSRAPSPATCCRLVPCSLRRQAPDTPQATGVPRARRRTSQESACRNTAGRPRLRQASRWFPRMMRQDAREDPAVRP